MSLEELWQLFPIFLMERVHIRLYSTPRKNAYFIDMQFFTCL